MSKTNLISSEKIKKPFVDLNRSQFVTGSQKHRHPCPTLHAFIEQGAATP